MTEQDKKELLVKITSLATSNNDTAAYSNGFEDAITLAEEVINTLPIDVVVGSSSKANAVAEYVAGLGISIAHMMEKGDHREYQWNGGGKNNPHRIEMLEAIHKKAMEAINSI